MWSFGTCTEGSSPSVQLDITEAHHRVNCLIPHIENSSRPTKNFRETSPSRSSTARPLNPNSRSLNAPTMPASDIMDVVPTSVQLVLLAIGVICLVKKVLDWLPLLFSFILPGTNVWTFPVPISLFLG